LKNKQRTQSILTFHFSNMHKYWNFTYTLVGIFLSNVILQYFQNISHCHLNSTDPSIKHATAWYHG